jgi:hypothetical protein
MWQIRRCSREHAKHAAVTTVRTGVADPVPAVSTAKSLVRTRDHVESDSFL